MICNTPLLQTLHSILSFSSPDEQCYFMRLEALWTLNNLSVFDSDNTMRLLLSTIDHHELALGSKELVSHIKLTKSANLQAIEQIITQILKQDCRDMKTLKMIFDFFYNLIADSSLVKGKVVRETSLLNVFAELIEHCSRWDANMLEDIYFMLKHLTKEDVELEEVYLHAFWKLASIGL